MVKMGNSMEDLIKRLEQCSRNIDDQELKLKKFKSFIQTIKN